MCNAFVIRVDKQSPAITCLPGTHADSQPITAPPSAPPIVIRYPGALVCVKWDLMFNPLSISPKPAAVSVNLYLVGNVCKSGSQHSTRKGNKEFIFLLLWENCFK